MESLRTLARRYRRHRFTALFGLLLLSIAGHGLIGKLLPVANPLGWLLGISLVAVVYSAPRGRLRWLLGGLAATSVALRLTQEIVAHPAPLMLSESLMGLTCLAATGAAVRRALAAGPVDLEHITAALDAYLLVGIAFGAGYWVLEALQPGSFACPEPGGLTPARAVYFSFVTQATLGFGDIVPTNQDAQGVVVAQGVGGQMYLAVLVARLVSLYSAKGRT